MHSAAAAIMGAAQCVDLLYNAEVNHRYLDQQVDTADTPAFSPNAKPAFVPPHVPSAARVDRAVPEGRDASGLDVPEQLWPNGDLEKLRIAADAWHAAAGELRTAAALANGPIRSVRRQRSPELRLAVTYCTKVRDGLTAVAVGCDAAGTTCSEYSNAVRDAQSKIRLESPRSVRPPTLSWRRRLKRRLGL